MHLEKSEMWLERYEEMLVRKRQSAWVAGSDGLWWMFPLEECWTIKNLEVRDDGRFVFRCDIETTLETEDEELRRWQDVYVDAEDVGD